MGLTSRLLSRQAGNSLQGVPLWTGLGIIVAATVGPTVPSAKSEPYSLASQFEEGSGHIIHSDTAIFDHQYTQVKAAATKVGAYLVGPKEPKSRYANGGGDVYVSMLWQNEQGDRIIENYAIGRSDNRGNFCISSSPFTVGVHRADGYAFLLLVNTRTGEAHHGRNVDSWQFTKQWNHAYSTGQLLMDESSGPNGKKRACNLPQGITFTV